MVHFFRSPGQLTVFCGNTQAPASGSSVICRALVGIMKTLSGAPITGMSRRAAFDRSSQSGRSRCGLLFRTVLVVIQYPAYDYGAICRVHAAGRQGSSAALHDRGWYIFRRRRGALHRVSTTIDPQAEFVSLRLGMTCGGWGPDRTSTLTAGITLDRRP